MLTHRLTVIAMGVLLLAGLSVGATDSALAAPPAEATQADTDNIFIRTDSEAAEIAAGAAARYTEMGVPTQRADLKVWATKAGDLIIAPSWASPDLAVSSDGNSDTFTTPAIPHGDTSSLAELEATPMATPYWGLWGHGCVTRFQTWAGYIDSCYKIHKMMNDLSPQYDFYQLEHYATAGPKSPARLFSAFLSSQKSGSSATMYWFDWDPRSDWQGNCQTTNISVTIYGIGIGSSHTRCEEWDITKYAEAGKFKNEWKDPWGVTGDREVAYMTLIYVAQGATPSWNLTHGFEAAL